MALQSSDAIGRFVSFALAIHPVHRFSAVGLDEISSFETRRRVKMPADLREYHHVLGGTASHVLLGDTEISLWELDAYVPVGEADGWGPVFLENLRMCSRQGRDELRDAATWFYFGTWAIDSVHYAVHLPHTGPSSGVIALNEHCSPLADSFAEFLELVMRDSTYLRPSG